MRHGLPTVAVVGRPNVGKSTFFNRLIGHKLAIVEDQPGVTRDRNFARAEWAGRAFYLVDTGGIEVDTHELLPTAVRNQVNAAIQESDVIIFVVDAQVGPHPVDFRIAEMLRVRNVKATRIARGVPLGGELEYVDAGTISQALLDRRGI